MVVRSQMDQIQLPKSDFEYVESKINASTPYMVIQSPTEQLSLVVTRCLFHAFSAKDHAQLRPEVAIML